MKEWGDPLFCLYCGQMARYENGRTLFGGPRTAFRRRAGNRLRERMHDMAEEGKKRGSTTEIVRALAQPLAAELGLALWDVTFTKEGADWYLRIFIDKPGGVSIDDCVDMTHAVNPVLDREDPIPQEYTLEVSSPGINRKLTRPEHFEAFLEAPVRVKLIRPLENGVRELEGILIDVQENGDFEIITDEETTVTFTKKECAAVHLIEDYDT